MKLSRFFLSASPRGGILRYHSHYVWDTLGDVYLAVFFDALWLPVLVAKFLLPLSSVFPASRRPNRASAECGRLSTELVSTTSTLSVRLRSALQGSTVLLRPLHWGKPWPKWLGPPPRNSENYWELGTGQYGDDKLRTPAIVINGDVLCEFVHICIFFRYQWTSEIKKISGQLINFNLVGMFQYYMKYTANLFRQHMA